MISHGRETVLAYSGREDSIDRYLLRSWLDEAG